MLTLSFVARDPLPDLHEIDEQPLYLATIDAGSMISKPGAAVAHGIINQLTLE